jgi:lysophospholipase L1-like esterase
MSKHVRGDLWFRNLRDGNGDVINVTIMAYSGARILPPRQRKGICRLLDHLNVANQDFILIQAGANDIKRDNLPHQHRVTEAYGAALWRLRQRMGANAQIFVSAAVSNFALLSLSASNFDPQYSEIIHPLYSN